MLLRGHARPGRALLPCTIYPLSAASLRAQRYCTCESVMRQPQLSSYLRAWEVQQLPVNHFLGCCSSFFVFLFQFFNSPETLSSFGNFVCSWYFKALPRKVGFTGNSSCRFQDTDFTPEIGIRMHLFKGGCWAARLTVCTCAKLGFESQAATSHWPFKSPEHAAQACKLLECLPRQNSYTLPLGGKWPSCFKRKMKSYCI